MRDRRHCVRGHVLNAANVLVDNRGWKRCKACHRDAALASYHRRKKLRRDEPTATEPASTGAQA